MAAPVLTALAPHASTLLKYLAAYLIGKEVVGVGTTLAEQKRTKSLGEKQIELMIKQLSAQSEGQREALEFNQESTDKFLRMTREDRAMERSASRQANADQLRATNQQQQLAILATLIQGISQQQNQSVQAMQVQRTPPPISMVNLMRGL